MEHVKNNNSETRVVCTTCGLPERRLVGNVQRPTESSKLKATCCGKEKRERGKQERLAGVVWFNNSQPIDGLSQRFSVKNVKRCFNEMLRSSVRSVGFGLRRGRSRE